jgi:hypothetical protein
MTLRYLITKILEDGMNLDEHIKVRLLVRNTNGVAIEAKEADVDFLTYEGKLLVTSSNFKEASL